MIFDAQIIIGQLRFVTNNLYVLDDESYDFVLEKGNIVMVLEEKTKGKIWDEHIKILTFAGPRKVNSGWLISQTMIDEHLCQF